MLAEFTLSIGWLFIAFLLSGQVLLMEFRRIDCLQHLFQSARAELEVRSTATLLPVNQTDGITYVETDTHLRARLQCPNLSLNLAPNLANDETITFRKLPMKSLP